MPQRPNKPCRHRGCNTLSRNACGYCDVHQAEAVGWNRSRNGTSTERGYGYWWRKLRAVILRRDDGLCVPCRKAGCITTATEVDHITSKAQAKRLGWTKEQMDAHENLQSICEACHRAKTAIERD